MTPRSSRSLTEWFTALPPTDEERTALAALQMPTLQTVVARNPELGGAFVERAVDYSIQREAFLATLTGPEPNLAELPFEVESEELLTAAAKRGRGVIVLVTHCGFWVAAPVWVLSRGLPLSFLFEAAPPALTELYDALGVTGIQAVEGVEIQLAGGRMMRIPGSQPLRTVAQALERGHVTAFFGDTFRRRGVAASVLGTPIPLIDHYACLAVRSGAPVLYLRQWTSETAIHLEFVPVAVERRQQQRAAAVRTLVTEFAKLLDADLRRRPEQYAYGPESIFAWASRRAEDEG